MPLSDHKDFLTFRGARAIAEHINAYWRDRGYDNVRAYTVKRPGTEDYDVRSNLVCGLPR